MSDSAELQLLKATLKQAEGLPELQDAIAEFADSLTEDDLNDPQGIIIRLQQAVHACPVVDTFGQSTAPTPRKIH